MRRLLRLCGGWLNPTAVDKTNDVVQVVHYAPADPVVRNPDPLGAPRRETLLALANDPCAFGGTDVSLSVDYHPHSVLLFAVFKFDEAMVAHEG
jgi:hypothetical protein